MLPGSNVECRNRVFGQHFLLVCFMACAWLQPRSCSHSCCFIDAGRGGLEPKAPGVPRISLRCTDTQKTFEPPAPDRIANV